MSPCPAENGGHQSFSSLDIHLELLSRIICMVHSIPNKITCYGCMSNIIIIVFPAIFGFGIYFSGLFPLLLLVLAYMSLLASLIIRSMVKPRKFIVIKLGYYNSGWILWFVWLFISDYCDLI
jgi:hypothetical protein